MEVKVRKATSGEVEELSELVMQFREEHSRLIGGNRDVNPNKIMEEVSRRIAEKDAGYFVAIHEGNVVGYRSWEFRDEFYFTKELFVQKENRREGVAKVLIREIEDWLLERGQEIACISCVPGNLAMIELARSEGYRILNRLELRKNLTDEPLEPKERERALGLGWQIF